MLFRKNSRI
ncbi:hypothetical protein MXB_1554 [Myxobolus squamalis]|nr:hypothetical protein MXB_1554 [Myxobolus squamalis]